MAELKITVAKVERIKDKDRGLDFLAYKTLTKKGKFMDLRFRREVKNAPEEPCVIVVNEEKCNVDDQRKYPVLWVSEIKRIEPFEQKKSNASKYFGTDDDEAESDMPF